MRYNDPKKKLRDTCKRLLWGTENMRTLDLDSGYKVLFKMYNRCVDDQVTKLSACIPKLGEACQSVSVRAIKTVRATMDEVEPLLNSDPNFRVLHLYRDPRAVYRSRSVKTWSWSFYEKPSTTATKTAKVYCQTVLHDYKKRKELERKFPGRIKSIIYDDFMTDTAKARLDIYKFLGMTVSNTNIHTIKREVKPRRKASIKWMTELAPEALTDIEAACQELADTIGVTWRL